jgi:uncharacterized membrane-anchored protein
MRMSRPFILALILAAPAVFADKAPAAPVEEQITPEQARAFEKEAFGYQDGPINGDLGNATVAVPAKFMFTGMAGTRKWAEATSGAADGDERGLLQPFGGNWTALFRYEETGHINDDDKDEIDAKAILDGYVEGTRAGNEQRRTQGIPAIVPESLKWEVPPYYNEATHAVEWAIAATEEGTNERIVNFNTKVLGRQGVTSVVLMFGNETQLTDVLPQFRDVMGKFSYKAGETYGEYKKGDKLAEYGLAALVGGGAVAIAAKTGLFAVLFKFLAKGAKLVIVAVVGLGALIVNGAKKLMGRKDG